MEATAKNIPLNLNVFTLNWIGLHLFNEDTRPQRHISRLPQAGFSQLFMLYKQITESSGVVKMR